jgi:ribosomal protein S18 acetylase RimI-like enzyme
VRPLDRARDEAAVRAIDTTFQSDRAYAVTRREDGLQLVLRDCAPRSKTLPFRLEEGTWQHAWVAEERDRLVGFAATRYESWNRRVVVAHLYVDVAARGRGIGRALMARALGHGRSQGAQTAWLETQNVNAPAVAAYRALGFELCGLDLTLYRATPAEGEFALFMAKDLRDQTSGA